MEISKQNEKHLKDALLKKLKVAQMQYYKGNKGKNYTDVMKAIREQINEQEILRR